MLTLLRFTVFIVFCFYCVVGNGQVIYTVAGSDNAYENVSATTVSLNSPNCVTVDAAGNMYIAETGNNRIRKINTAGIISTIAGVGAGFGGDGGAAISAQLLHPKGIALDANGNLYIADADNRRIRKVNAAGIISTIAGNGTYGFGGNGGAATAAQLDSPTGVAVDGVGNVYIADFDNNRVQKVNTSGIISTIAGKINAGSSGDGGQATAAFLYKPYSLAFDGLGNLYISEQGNNKIRKINAAGIITTVVGNGTPGFSGDGGLATAAQLNYPYGVSVSASGNIYIADYYNQAIRMVNTSGIISTIAGTGTYGYNGDGILATTAQFCTPTCVTTDASGNVYIADYNDYRVRKINNAGIITTICGNGQQGYNGDAFAATNATFATPRGITSDASGNIFIADKYNHRVRKIDGTGKISTVAGNGINGYSGDGGMASLASISYPYDVAVDQLGNIFIAEYGNNCVRKVDKNGIISTIAGNGIGGISGDGGLATAAQLSYPSGLAVDALGNLFVAEYDNQRIRKIDVNGIITTVAGGGSPSSNNGDGAAATLAYIGSPLYVAIDKLGNIYITSSFTSRIRKVDVSGIISTIAGDDSYGFGGDGGTATAAKLNSPQAIKIDAANNIYIADANNSRIRIINSAGIINTIAGNGTFGFSGDGGLPITAALSGSRGIAIDASGNLYINDNNRIRKICITAQPATTKTADSSNTTTIFDVNNTIALHNGCDAIANLTPNGSNPVLGPINSQVWLDATQNTGYVKRHYQITPSLNPTTSTATVTLFFTQADFDDFNAVNAVKLPQNPTDATGKANFKVEKRSGVSFDATGLPSTYNGTVVIIDPDDANIVWNNTLSRWEVTFNVTGFSGFFVKTNAVVLPVQWLSISGQLNNSQLTEINWQVQEQNVSIYEVQKSSDGISFKVIGTINSLGNGLHNYHFTENQPLNGKAIYRIKQTDIDGKIDFSKAVYLGTNGKTMLYPNQATSTTTLFSSAEMLGNQALLYDLQGKLLQQIIIQQNVQTINLSNFSKGVYMLKLANGQTIKIIKE